MHTKHESAAAAAAVRQPHKYIHAGKKRGRGSNGDEYNHVHSKHYKLNGSSTTILVLKIKIVCLTANN